MSSIDLRPLGEQAWAAREHARLLLGKTKVGAAVLSTSGRIFTGCNIQHQFRCHDVHAEVNALSTMTAHGEGPALAVLIAAERDKFTPCGSCLDWIFELGGSTCIVAFQSAPGGTVQILRADELMPHYPC